jgi:branched-chain amino acid transport system substrate-binding protein
MIILPRYQRYTVQLLLFSFIILFTSGCSPSFEKMAERRFEYAKKNTGDIYIAAIDTYNSPDSSFINGAQLAAEIINQQPNKLIGRNLKIEAAQDGQTFQESKTTIERITSNPKIVAAIGHGSSSIAVPASALYERSQLILLSSFSTIKGLTGHGFKYIFRMSPNAQVMADQLASVAKTLNYKKIIILHARGDVYRELAFLFEDATLSSKIDILKRLSFFEKSEDYRSIISQFNDKPFDAIFIAAPTNASALMAKQLREMGLNQPILGGDALNSSDYYEVAQQAANNTIVPSLYNPKSNNKMVQDFIKQYKKKYKEEPNNVAAQAYDSIMLLANAIEEANSTLPSSLTSTLHYMPAWVGATGLHAFNPNGEIQGKKYLFKVWKSGMGSGTKQELPAIHIPYLLERFAENMNGGKPSEKSSSLISKFSEKMHEDDHKVLLLELAQEILTFKNIGLIYEATEEGKKVANHALVEKMVNKQDIKLSSCIIPFSILHENQYNKSITSCYGKLSLGIDALYTSPIPSNDNKHINYLNKSLAFFKIPAISLDKRNKDNNISLVLQNRPDINVRGTGKMKVYNGLLNNMKVHQFSEKMVNLPHITVNLNNLHKYGISDKAILDLSPDDYLYSDED